MALNTERPLFDKSVSFTFFGSWLDSFHLLEQPNDSQSPAYRLFTAIANYSLYDNEPRFDDLGKEDCKLLSVIWPVLKHEIDMSVSRRTTGFNRKYSSENRAKVAEARAENPTASVREISELTGVSKSTVQRQLQAIEKETAKSAPISRADKLPDDCDDLPWEG